MAGRRMSGDAAMRRQAEMEAQRLVVQKIKENISSYKGLKLEVPNVSLDSFIGLDEIKREMLLTLNKSNGRQKILLFGAFYCGKSHLVRALATHLQANLIDVWDEEILVKWSNRLEVFTQALYEICKEKSNRTLLFLEQVNNQDVSTLIRFLDNVQRIWAECSEGKSTLTVIGTTFEPKSVRKEVIQHFNYRIYIPTPNFQERKLLISKFISDFTKGAQFQLKDKDVDWLAKKLYGCVPLEIETKIHEAFSVNGGKDDVNGFMRGIEDICKRPLTKNDFKKAFKSRAPCPMDSKTFAEFSDFQQSFGTGPFMNMHEREELCISHSADEKEKVGENGKDLNNKSAHKSFVARLLA